MNEELKEDETVPSEKLQIDNPSDFQFHAAYLTYSDVFDNTVDLETKKQLNQSIIALQQDQIDYSSFYKNISQYREASPHHRYKRDYIKTQRKREWRRKARKRERNKRHKK